MRYLLNACVGRSRRSGLIDDNDLIMIKIKKKIPKSLFRHLRRVVDRTLKVFFVVMEYATEYSVEGQFGSTYVRGRGVSGIVVRASREPSILPCNRKTKRSCLIRYGV